MNGLTITAEAYKVFTDEQASHELNRLATQLMLTDRWVTDLAPILGVDRRTLQAWKTGTRRPPESALAHLEALVRVQDLQELAQLVQRTSQLAAQLA